MTVQELIDKLQKLENKEAQVCIDKYHTSDKKELWTDCYGVMQTKASLSTTEACSYEEDYYGQEICLLW